MLSTLLRLVACSLTAAPARLNVKELNYSVRISHLLSVSSRNINYFAFVFNELCGAFFKLLCARLPILHSEFFASQKFLHAFLADDPLDRTIRTLE
jgi:hypothetical protein